METPGNVQQVVEHLHRLNQGQGPNPILFLHGWSCCASDWETTLAGLAQDHPVMALDLPGHGESSDVAWHDATITGLARLVMATARQAGIQQLTLVGHSMGGAVALESARLWALEEGAGKLAGVILVDTFGLPYGDMDEDTIASLENPFRDDFVAAMHNLVDSTTAASIAPDTREWIKRRMSSADPQRMLPIWADLLRWSPDEAFAELDCPITAINGEHISESARQRCAPHVEEVVMKGCHHFPLFEQPDAFVQTLKQVLSCYSVSSPSPASS